MAMGQFAYANNTNRFLAVEPLTDQPFAVSGVPFDGVVTNRPGARFGPQAINGAPAYRVRLPDRTGWRRTNRSKIWLV